MNRTLAFSKRNFKELIRDPIALIFEIVLPLVLLFIFHQINIPGETYKLENFTPGIIVFGLSFITLFTATLVAKDRSSSLLFRLGASPMKSADYIVGYTLPLLLIVILQNILFFTVAGLMGLSFSMNTVLAGLSALAISLFFIILGILLGTLVSEKATGGIGSIIVQLVCFTSGMYFSREMVGEVFAKICEILPFESCLTVVRSILNGSNEITARDIVILTSYTIIVTLLTLLCFKRKREQ